MPAMRAVFLGSLVLILVVISATSAQYVSVGLFKCMFPNGKNPDALVPAMNAALHKYQINTRNRIRMFLAQTGHETMGYFITKEWTNKRGTNKFCHRYNGGCSYIGRGPIQVTHKYNYKTYGQLLGVDFVKNPKLLETPKYGFLAAGAFWNLKKLNSCADRGDIRRCTKIINGGYNGLADRIKYFGKFQTCAAKFPPGKGPGPGGADGGAGGLPSMPLGSAGPKCSKGGKTGTCVAAGVCKTAFVSNICKGGLKCCF